MNLDVNSPSSGVRRLRVALSDDRRCRLRAAKGEHPVDITASLDEAFAPEVGLSPPDLNFQALKVRITRAGWERRCLVPLPRLFDITALDLDSTSMIHNCLSGPERRGTRDFITVRPPQAKILRLDS